MSKQTTQTTGTTEKKEYINYQVYRIDGKNVFLEILNSALGINKVVINFIKYDSQSFKQVSKISIYLNKMEALRIANDILNGRFAKLAKIELDKGNKYANAIYTSLGGTSSARLAKQNKSRTDGAAIARQFKIVPGSRSPWVLEGHQGKGKELENGLISMEKSEEVVRVPLKDDDLKEFALAIQLAIQSYETASYVAKFSNIFNSN